MGAENIKCKEDLQNEIKNVEILWGRSYIITIIAKDIGYKCNYFE